MICRLCLDDVDDCFGFFSAKGNTLNAVQIVGQHFWFQPNENDCFSKTICENCWECVNNFHTFYILVENAHKILISIKSDPFEEKPSCNYDNQENGNKPFSFDENIEYMNSVNDTKISEVVCEEYGCNKPLNIEADIDSSKTIKLRRSDRKKTLSDNETQVCKTILDATAKKDSKRKARIKNQQKVEETRQTEILDTKKKYAFFTDEQIAKIKALNCNICSEKISTFSELKKHMDEIHRESGYAVCCDKKFYKRYKFVSHLQMHLNPEEFKCPHCDKRLGSKKYIKLHIKNMHTEIGKMKKFSCDQCEKTFAQKAYLERHKLGHIPDNEKRFACEICGNRFPTPALLRVHTLNVHESRHSAICDLCGKKYKSPADLKRHRLEHMGIHEPKVQCEICGDWLSNKYKLKRHMLKHTTADVEHRCPICNKVSANLLALKSHMRLHIAARKFQCSICEKGFRRSLNLKEHMTTHTGEALYSCPNCTRTFTHHSNLHHHRKKMHPKELEEDRKIKHLKIENYNKTYCAANIIKNEENVGNLQNTVGRTEAINNSILHSNDLEKL